jgi:hypothetical protein
MTRRDLLETLAAAGVALRIEGDAIRYTAARGALTPALRCAAIEAKSDLLHDYEERAAIMEFDGNMTRAEAERLASADVLGVAGIRERGAK